MKKLRLLLLFIILSHVAGSQAGQINQINIVNFTVKNTLPGTIDSWLTTPGALILTAQKVPSAQVREPMMVLQIRSGPAVICGNSSANPKRVDPFDVRVFNTADLVSMLGNCHELKAGTYTICVQFFNIDKVAISREVCKDFRVEESNIEYSPPTLITPANEKKFTKRELEGLLMFRWTPLVPKPKEPVTYRLRVWQLMEGQNGPSAMRSNQPLVTKDVDNLTQATVNNLYTGPCKPPYLCDFIWNVQALNRNGKPMGNNNGTSEPFNFKMASNDIDIQIDSVHVGCCGTNGSQNIYIKLKNNLTNTVKITQLNIDKVNGATNVIPIIGLAPVLAVNIAGGGSQVFTGTIKCIDTAKTIRFFVRAEDAIDNAITETEVETDTLDCPCDPCRYMSISVDKDSLKLPKNGNPTQVNLIGSFVGLNPNLVKKVTAEIIYFNITQTKDSNCAKCVFDSKNYGNFYPPGSGLPNYTGPIFNKPDYTHLITWNSTVIKDCGGNPHDDGGDHNGGVINGIRDDSPDVIGKKTDMSSAGLNTNPSNKQSGIIGGGNIPPPALPSFILPIAVPEMNNLGCCGDIIKICIRYTFYDFCCHACELIKCYEIKREK